MSSKGIYGVISEDLYGGIFPYKNLDESQKQVCLRNINGKNLSEKKRDVMWLVSVRRLAVRAVVKWSCFVTTVKCPIVNCNQDETVEHLLVDCYRSRLVWGKMKQIGLKINVHYNAAMYGVFDERMTAGEQDFYWTIVCTVVYKLWLTRCAKVIHQEDTPGDVVFKQIQTELRRQRTIDLQKKKLTPWHLLNL